MGPGRFARASLRLSKIAPGDFVEPWWVRYNHPLRQTQREPPIGNLRVPRSGIAGPVPGPRPRVARASRRLSKIAPGDFVEPWWVRYNHPLRQSKEKSRPWAAFFFGLAERVGFEPTVGLHQRLISSQVHSTTLPPLRCIAPQVDAGPRMIREGGGQNNWRGGIARDQLLAAKISVATAPPPSRGASLTRQP